MEKRKYTYSRGESLSELLVASLIISLAMIMLLSGTKVGTDIMAKNREKYKTYNDNLNQYEEDQAQYIVDYYEAYSIPENFKFDMSPRKQ